MFKHINLIVFRNGERSNVYTVDAENDMRMDAVVNAMITKEYIDAYNSGFDMSKLDFKTLQVINADQPKKVEESEKGVMLFAKKDKKNA